MLGGFDIATLLLSLPALILALTVHEYAHARVADRLGDPTPRLNGRLTLEPWAHLDPIGTLLLVIYRFGWAKPVPINPSYFRDPRRGMLLTSLAGPLANVALAFLASLLLAFRFDAWPLVREVPYIGNVIGYVLILNLYFAVFNLIPIPPLDGSKVLMALLPGEQAYALSRLEPYGPFVLILFLVSGAGIIRSLAMSLFGVIQAVTSGLAGLFGL